MYHTAHGKTEYSVYDSVEEMLTDAAAVSEERAEPISYRDNFLGRELFLRGERHLYKVVQE